MRDPDCTCHVIMAEDDSRHFRGCSVRAQDDQKYKPAFEMEVLQAVGRVLGGGFQLPADTKVFTGLTFEEKLRAAYDLGRLNLPVDYNPDTYTFEECATCRKQPGSFTPLCEGCIHNRSVIVKLLKLVEAKKGTP